MWHTQLKNMRDCLVNFITSLHSFLSFQQFKTFSPRNGNKMDENNVRFGFTKLQTELRFTDNFWYFHPYFFYFGKLSHPNYIPRQNYLHINFQINENTSSSIVHSALANLHRIIPLTPDINVELITLLSILTKIWVLLYMDLIQYDCTNHGSTTGFVQAENFLFLNRH